jgi:CHASE3 domain sensor protein
VKTEDVRKAIDICDRIITELDKLKAEIDETLPDSRKRSERAFAELRRAGYLR